MLIADHINLLGDNPLIGAERRRRSVLVSRTCQRLMTRICVALLARVAADRGFTLREGVYVAVTGPNLETRAEYRFLPRHRARTWSGCQQCRK